MPTTSYTASTFAASVIGARTDATPAAVTDLSAEEARISQQVFSPGYLASTAFTVAQQASPNMTVKIGSGTAKADYYVLAGTVAGQGTYIARLDTTSQNVTISAADASQTRTDEVYLVLRDNLYDSSGFALPEFGYRKGDLGGANPGADATWKAYALLARITVAPAVTTIVTANISDQRTAGGIQGLNVTALNALSGASVTAGTVGTVTVNTVTLNATAAVTGASVTASGAVTGADVKVGSTSLPRGIICQVQRTSDSPLTSGGGTLAGATAVMRTSCSMVSGRRYRVFTSALLGSTQTAGYLVVNLMYDITGANAGVGSTRLCTAIADMPNGSIIRTIGPLAADYVPSSNISFSVIMVVYSNALGATYGRTDSPLQLNIEDLGVDPGGSGTVF